MSNCVKNDAAMSQTIPAGEAGAAEEVWLHLCLEGFRIFLYFSPTRTYLHRLLKLMLKVRNDSCTSSLNI